jgi:hypothetical protein
VVQDLRTPDLEFISHISCQSAVDLNRTLRQQGQPLLLGVQHIIVIAKGKTVAHLKRVIKKEKGHGFASIDFSARVS